MTHLQEGDETRRIANDSVTCTKRKPCELPGNVAKRRGLENLKAQDTSDIIPSPSPISGRGAAGQSCPGQNNQPSSSALPTSPPPPFHHILVICPNCSTEKAEGLRISCRPPPGTMVSFAFINDETRTNDHRARLQSTNIAIELLSKEKAFAKYDGFLVASFSDHPLTEALELKTDKPITDVFHASINFARARLRKGFFGIVASIPPGDSSLML